VGSPRPAHRRRSGASYSLLTDYEFGAFKVLSMPVHLTFDATKGVFTASSPWLFGFAKKGTRYWLTHVLMGTADVMAAITSKTGLRDEWLGNPMAKGAKVSLLQRSL
jgi:hypothetical protein